MTANNAMSTPLVRVSRRRIDFGSIAVGTSLPIVYFLEVSILATFAKTYDPYSKFGYRQIIKIR